MKKLCALLLVVTMNSLFASSENFSNMVIFGDSLSDTANNTWVQTEGAIGAPITNPDADNRRTMWPDSLGELLFPATPAIQSYADIMNLFATDPAQALKANADFAFASAETDGQYVDDSNPQAAFPPYNAHCQIPGFFPTLNYACVPDAEMQVNLYLAAIDAAKVNINPNTIFILWAGANDLFDNILRIVNGAGDATTPAVNMSKAVEALVTHGVAPDHIFVVNLPNIADTPAAIKLTKGNPDALAALNLYTVHFNLNLFDALVLKDGLPAKNIISAYNILNFVLANAETYGFTNTQGDCVADGKAPACTGYLFFNDKHPTTRTHSVLAEFFFEAI